MTFEQNSALPKRFVTCCLPWIIGAGALVIYLATMNQWVTFGSTGLVGLVAGWDWHANLHRPLLMFVLYPFRFLPEASIPLALNIFNAILAALVLTLLARSVALLPHNRTAAQRDVEKDDNALFSSRAAWIPPVLAALALGLQISFWENATSMTGEMIDAFVVAYVIRCLLEFRIDEKQSWLTRAAFLYAAGMTNNWALVGLAPFFLIALIWMKGLGFFNLQFLIRMALWSAVGLLFYLLLPLVSSHSTIAHVDFWPALKLNLSTQWSTLGGIYRFYKDNYRVVVMAATSLLPILVISLRWSSSFGDNSPLGIFVAKAVFHFVHTLFLGICLLVVLSPPWSPRQILVGIPFLTHAILGAIVIGYCAGYFLLVCSPAFTAKRMNLFLKMVSYVGWGAVALMLVIMPAILISRNLDPIRLTNTRLVEDFARHLERGLPATRVALLGDNPLHLALLRAHLLKQGRAQNYLFYDTASATITDYHAFEYRRAPDRWPATFAKLTNNVQISPLGMVMFLSSLATNTPIYYLQPSFGYYFERFQQIPKGLIYPLTAYPTNQLLASPLTAAVAQANQEFWSEFDTTTLPFLTNNLPTENLPAMPAWQANLMTRFHLAPERVLIAEALASHYSRATTYWGVELQKLGKWDEAAVAFDRALALNPDNVAAQINLAFNTTHRADQPAPADFATSIEDRFGKYRNWNDLMGDCGPFDEPRFTFEQSRTFLAGRLHRQSLQQMKRVTDLDPRNFTARVWLADLYTMLNQPAESMNVVQHVRHNATTFSLNATNELELARVEISALFRSGDTNAAKLKLAHALTQPAVSSQFRMVASQLYLQNSLFAEALPLLKRAVAENPTDLMALANLGFTYLQLGQFDNAREILNRALELDPKNAVVRLNHAIALLRLKQWDAAREDYELLLQDFPNGYQILFGLGEVAAGKGDLAEATRYFEKAMKATPPGSRDFLQVSNRLEQIKSEKK